MKINSQNIEFGYELISVIPYACYLNSIGQLQETTSGNDTDCLYYFSPKHNINKDSRSWYNTNKVSYPNINIHKPYLDKQQFLSPDYKNHFKNHKFKFKKETVVICNRHNVEWSTKPINYFNIPTLRSMFEMLKDYQVIYINVEGRPELYDNAPPISLNEWDIIKEYDNVINIHDLHKQNSNYSFNELQLMIFANCEKYITMNGGHAILASYFGGENIIMSKPGKPHAKEIHPAINSFYTFYNEFGNQRCIHVPDEEKLLKKISSLWVKKDPIVNILIRTSGRPNFFRECMKSIENQTYENINIFCSIDNETDNYTVKYPVYPVRIDKIKHLEPVSVSEDYGKPMVYNLYLNILHKKVKSGLIMYMDDDDMYTSNKAISNIVNEYKKGNEFVIWQVKVGRKVVPSDDLLNKPPKLFNISGIGFAFDAKYKDIAEWEGYKRGDYRVAKKLYEKIENVSWINKILAETQKGSHFGSAVDLVEITQNDKEMKKLIKIEILKDKFKGNKLKHNVGEVKEVPLSVGNQLIKLKLAKEFEEKKPVEKVSEQKVEEKKVIKKVMSTKRIKK